jgi:2-phosphosulfolactate phosphatase
MQYHDQADFDIRCEWGAAGIQTLAPISDVVIVVDVLSFSTCVDIAVSRGAIIYPYHVRDDTASAFAESLGAILAGSRRQAAGGYSLAPSSLTTIPEGTSLVLPSPNGATLSMATGAVPTFAGCLRNARAVAEAASKIGRRVSIIPAGERWTDGSLRPALEDQIGAGAIIHFLKGVRSPESQLAEQAFLAFQDQLESLLLQCSSGKELVGEGFSDDVRLAAALNASTCAPFLRDAAYRQHV